MPALLMLLLVVLAAPAHAQWEPGHQFTQGLTLDVTAEGFAALGDAAPALIPSTVELPTDSNGYNLYEADSGTCCDPITDWICWTCWEYEFAIWNGWLTIDLSDLTLEPRDGRLALSTDATITVARSWDPMYIYGYGEAGINDVGVSLDVDTTCQAYTDPFEVGLGASVYLDVVNGPDGRRLEATIPHLDWSHGISGNDLHLSDCFLGDLIDFIQDTGGLVGFDPIGEVIDLLEGTIDDQIQAMAPELEAVIEDAFAQARVEESVDLGESILDVTVEPWDVEVAPAGARLTMAGAIDADLHPCVADVAGSLETGGVVPPIGVAPSGVVSPHHLGAIVSDDFANSGLYAAWRAGLLCYDLAGSSDLPLNTSLLSLLSDEAYGDLFPEQKPVRIATRPGAPPEAFPQGAHDMNVEVTQLGVDMYAELDYRQARMLGTDVETEVGIDFSFDDQTGDLLLDIAFDPGRIDAVIAYDEITPEHDAEIEESFGAVFDSLMGPLLGGFLEDVTFPLPSVQGFGVSSLEYAPAGAQGRFFGLYGTVGEVSYENSGGCGESAACDGGCATGGGGGALIALCPALLVLLRRRS